MTYRHAFILQSALDSIQREARRFLCRETGGPLAGYVSLDGAIVVTHSAGPGKKGVRRPFSVTISGKNAQAFCDDVYRKSNGMFDYVGDWHSHMGCSSAYSGTDVEAMIGMASSTHCPIRHPISLIYGRYSGEFSVYVLEDGGWFRHLPVSIIKSVPGVPAFT